MLDGADALTPNWRLDLTRPRDRLSLMVDGVARRRVGYAWGGIGLTRPRAKCDLLWVVQARGRAEGVLMETVLDHGRIMPVRMEVVLARGRVGPFLQVDVLTRPRADSVTTFFAR